MKIVIALLGMWCGWNCIRITDQLGHAIVFGGNLPALWAGLAVFFFGFAGCVFYLFGTRK